jgi:hypothetical protein
MMFLCLAMLVWPLWILLCEIVPTGPLINDNHFMPSELTLPYFQYNSKTNYVYHVQQLDDCFKLKGTTTLSLATVAQTPMLKRTLITTFVDRLGIIPSPGIILWMMSTLSRARTPHLNKMSSAACSCSHCKIAFVEDDRLDTDVCSTNSGMDAIEHHERSWSTSRTLSWDIPDFHAVMREFLHCSHCTAAFVAPSLTSFHTVHGWPAFTYAVGVTFLSHGDVPPIVETP